MPSSSIPLDSASQLLEKLRSREVSAVEVAQTAIDKIEAGNGQVGVFITSCRADEALTQAREIDARRVKGETLGQLAGIPVAVKDVLCTAGLRTTCASHMLSNYVPPYDATVVKQLRTADALIIGKTNMDEFAMGGSTETGYFGVTRNPWNLQCTPGGSSGGAAACVAAQFAPLSLGTDTGGSIRQPAAFCGVTGLKPTYGRVSRFGLVAFASSLDQVGPMAWDVKDVALLLQHIAAFDPNDSTSLDAPTPDYQEALKKSIKGMRIGIVHRDQWGASVDRAIVRALEMAIEVYRNAGATIHEVDLPHAPYWVPTYYVIAPCEASSNLSRYEGAHYGFRAEVGAGEAGKQGPLIATYCRSRAQGFGDEVKRRIMIGTYALSAGYRDAYYVKALQVRRLIRNDYDRAFQQVDLLLGPTTPSAAFGIGEKIDDPLQMYLCDLFTVGANLAGLPAMSLPAGFSDRGLPLGIQLQAPPLEEARLLTAGSVYQQATDWHLKRPQPLRASA